MFERSTHPSSASLESGTWKNSYLQLDTSDKNQTNGRQKPLQASQTKLTQNESKIDHLFFILGFASSKKSPEHFSKQNQKTKNKK